MAGGFRCQSGSHRVPARWNRSGPDRGRHAYHRLAWTGDGEFLLGAGGDSIRIWSRGDWEEVRTIAVEPNENDGKARAIVIGPIAINHDSSLFAAGWEHHVGLWRFDNEVPAAVLDGLPKGVYNLAFHEDGHLLGLGCADGRIRVWSV